MDDLSKAEDGIEAFALLIARYYDALRRGGVPADTAASLTHAYQDQVVKQQAGRAALASFGDWLKEQQLRGAA